MTGLAEESGEASRRPDEVAGITSRALARALDVLVWSLFILPLTLPFASLDEDGTVSGVPTWSLLLGLGGVAAYEAGLIMLRGQTVGKMAMRICMVDAKTGGQVPPVQASVRGLAIAGGLGLLSYFVSLVFVTAAFDRNTHRGVLDRLAGTVVVKA